MKSSIEKLVFLLCFAIFSVGLNAKTKGAPPKLTTIILTTASNSTTPLTCLQLLPNETITVYAVGLDEKGKPFAISKDSIVHWSGGDALEVKSTAAHSATVKLAKPLKAAVVKLSNHLSYEGKSFGSSVEIAQKAKEIPKVWSIQFFRDPEATRGVRDEEPVAAGEPLMVHARGFSADMATMGESFMIPIEASVTWSSVPRPPLGSEFKITPIGCFGAKIELIKKGNPDFGFDKSGMIKIEVDNLPDDKKREMPFSIKIK